MKTTFLVLSSILFFVSCVDTENKTSTKNKLELNYKNACAFNIDNNEMDIFIGETTSVNNIVLTNIMKNIGLPMNFEIANADVFNAFAFNHNNKRYIIYGEDFFKKVFEVTGTKNAELSILAHEVGHHLAGHTFIEDVSRPDLELEADKFSGYVMYQMGVPLNEACAAMNAFSDEKESDTHPAKKDRLISIENGWNEAKINMDKKEYTLVDTLSSFSEYIIDVKSKEKYITLRNRSLSPYEYKVSNSNTPQRDTLNTNTIICNLNNGTPIKILSSVGRTYYVTAEVQGVKKFGYIAKHFDKKPTILKVK